MKDKGFYAILAASVLMVCVAAYLAMSWGSSAEKINNDTGRSSDSINNDGETLEDGYVPDWPEEGESSSVEKEEGNISAGDDTQTETDDKDNDGTDENGTPILVEYMSPVDISLVVSKVEFSGSEPVFSETLGDWRLHQGIDYVTAESVPVYAAEAGVVEDVYDDGLMGTTVLLLHADGSRTIYQSLAVNPEVIKGMSVLKGDIIGKTGNTADSESLVGCHLHFALIVNGGYVNPDP